MSIKFGPTSACHVICLLLFLFGQSSNQQRCDDHVVCRGERPKLPNGCCPVEAGQPCQPANGSSCDAELGFSCLNVNGDAAEEGLMFCKGRFNLRATSVGETNVTLVWSGFAPTGYLFEYVLLTRERTNHVDIGQWRRREIGNQPAYTLRRLTPATLYFLKVAIWQDARAGILGNTTETIMVETHPVQFCEHIGRAYQVGEQFIHECEDNCTCMATGEFSCSPLCPENGLPEVEEGCYIARGNSCCDYRMVCPVPGEPCVLDGHSYSHGEQFETDCRTCTCNHGQSECVYRQECNVMEPSESCPFPRSRHVQGQCCPEWYCGNTCSYENRTYSHLEYFTSDHCGLCQCNAVDRVNCAPDCPPVEMVLPDAACPDPHIRQDGCCDTLYCHDLTLDTTEYIRRMFALSYSPVSLTLSFEVDPQSEVNGVPLYCQYEILFANSSDPFVTWTRRLVQPVDVRLHNDQPHLLQPMDALTRDNAIVVGDRAYVTLSGMHPNTTYYIKIIPLDGYWDDMAESGSFNYSDSKMAAVVAVRTMPLENITSCFHNGKVVLHGDRVSSHCYQDCVCSMGKITCHSACEAEQVVMAKSLTCPRPRLEKQEDDCCPDWKCYPTARGCRHGELIMEPGQTVTERCHVCTCVNASVHCKSICPPIGLPPRPGCQLVNISNHCCPEWQCPVELHLPYGVRSSVLIHFYGSCHLSAENFLEEMKTRIWNQVTSRMGCLNRHSNFAKFCNSVEVHVKCPGVFDDLREYRKRRSTVEDSGNPTIPVVVSLHLNFSTTTPDVMTAQLVKSAGLHLLMLLNSSFSITMDSGQVLTSLDGVKFEGESFICDHGFAFVKEFCTLSEIESKLSFMPNLQLSPTYVTNSSVVLEWPPLGDRVLNHITELLVEHRKEGSVEWLSDARLDSKVTSYNLTSLSPDQSFSARLTAITTWSGKGRWTIGEVHFRTKPTSAALTSSSIFTLTGITATETSVLFYWNHFPEQSQLASINILYKKIDQDLYEHQQRVSPVTQSYVQLRDLEPQTAYTVELVAVLTDDMTITSLPVHVVTMAARGSSAELLIAVVTSCVVTAGVSVILTLICVIWRQSRRKGKDSGFENKIFGIQLENNNQEVATEPGPTLAVN